MGKLDYNSINWSDWVYYDETSPTFLRWKVDRNWGRYKSILKMSVGDIAGNVVGGLYARTSFLDKLYLNHRIIWILFNGHIDPELFVDHIDRDKRNNNINNLRLVCRTINSRNLAARENTTGVTGVCLSNGGGGYYYYVAHWCDVYGERKQKKFSISKLGETDAFRLACEYRQRMIDELNAQGAGYADYHGT